MFRVADELNIRAKNAAIRRSFNPRIFKGCKINACGNTVCLWNSISLVFYETLKSKIRNFGNRDQTFSSFDIKFVGNDHTIIDQRLSRAAFKSSRRKVVIASKVSIGISTSLWSL